MSEDSVFPSQHHIKKMIVNLAEPKLKSNMLLFHYIHKI